jgi:hypothetical protein
MENQVLHDLSRKQPDIFKVKKKKTLFLKYNLIKELNKCLYVEKNAIGINDIRERMIK